MYNTYNYIHATCTYMQPIFSFISKEVVSRDPWTPRPHITVSWKLRRYWEDLRSSYINVMMLAYLHSNINAYVDAHM